jgi:hypothetical protein
MSDNEVVNEFNNGKIVDNDASDDDSSISDAKMKVVDKTSKIVKNGDDSDSDVENDHSSSTNNGFGVDGEPDYKPRKVNPCFLVGNMKFPIIPANLCFL